MWPKFHSSEGGDTCHRYVFIVISPYIIIGRGSPEFTPDLMIEWGIDPTTWTFGTSAEAKR